MRYQYILFDLDGTITESGPGIINSVYYALGKMGRKVTDKEGLRKFIGPSLSESMKKYYGMTQEEADQAVTYYREYFSEKGIFENSVYEGFMDSANRLKEKEKVLVIATSKPEEYARRIAEKFGFAGTFLHICGASMDGSLVEKADVIRYALKKTGISAEDYGKVLMVGDRMHDILGAKENGIDSMGVLYGYGSREELETAGADYIAETTREVAEMILALDK